MCGTPRLSCWPAPGLPWFFWVFHIHDISDISFGGFFSLYKTVKSPNQTVILHSWLMSYNSPMQAKNIVSWCVNWTESSWESIMIISLIIYSSLLKFLGNCIFRWCQSYLWYCCKWMCNHRQCSTIMCEICSNQFIGIWMRAKYFCQIWTMKKIVKCAPGYCPALLPRLFPEQWWCRQHGRKLVMYGNMPCSVTDHIQYGVWAEITCPFPNFIFGSG